MIEFVLYQHYLPSSFHFTTMSKQAAFFDVSCSYDLRKLHYGSLHTLLCYSKTNEKHIAIYVGFEADGMLAGYTGCDNNLAGLSHWQSTEENGGEKNGGIEICPIGKFGYDARCRG